MGSKGNPFYRAKPESPALQANRRAQFRRSCRRNSSIKFRRPDGSSESSVRRFCRNRSPIARQIERLVGRSICSTLSLMAVIGKFRSRFVARYEHQVICAKIVSLANGLHGLIVKIE
jgi:hypothetical protein